ncbi:helix-turn-helix domain-containing protein [Streptomyces sp. URMC 129]|uniref:helix-turn-helix domain-containing protein n=1 Tax=Streptomyces sp. URMC 129 TaxID=3423407 RepID=UPI003F1ADBF4
MAASSFGERLKEARKRAGLHQRDLARESGVSLSLIRKLEQGDRQDTRLETARKLAAALRIPTTRLIAAEAGDADPATGSDAARWAGVRAALTTTPPRDDIDAPPTAAGVLDALDSAIALYTGGNLDAVGELLPRLIRDATTLADLDPKGPAVRMRVMQITGRLMTQTRNYDAAELAFATAERDVPDAVHGAALANNQCWLLLRRGRLAESRALAIRWADDLEPRLSQAGASELSAWGWLLLRVAATASRDNRPDEAQHALRLATAAAVMLGPATTSATTRRAGFIRRFSRLTVAMQHAEQAMVEERPDQVLRLAGKIHATALPPTFGNRNRHLLDLAHAQVLTRRHGDAMETLLGVHRDAPQWLPHQRYAKETLALIVRKRRTLTPEMRALAEAVRLPL